MQPVWPGVLSQRSSQYSSKDPHRFADPCNPEFMSLGSICSVILSGEKPYTCPYPKCSYAACRKDMITRHLKVHNKSRQLGAKQTASSSHNRHSTSTALAPSSPSLFMSTSYPLSVTTSSSNNEAKSKSENPRNQIESRTPQFPNNLIIPIIRIEET
jgi:hypothetical protein